jgi:hypothetical protein
LKDHRSKDAFNVEMSERFWLNAAVASSSYTPKINSWTACNEKYMHHEGNNMQVAGVQCTKGS